MSFVEFELRVAEPPGGAGKIIPTVEVRGDVDTTNAAGLKAALRDLASPALVVDLSAADYFDSAGFAAIDDLLDQVRLAIVVSPGSVLRAAATLMSIPFHDTIEQARASLQPA